MKAAIETYLGNIVKDMASENAKVPVNALRIEATNIEGNLYSPDWFQYMVYGRGPGKQPPPDKLLAWVKRNPQILNDARSTWKYITEKGLAYIIGRKIGREGTDIWLGKRKGVDLLGAMEKNLPALLEGVLEEETLEIKKSLSTVLK